jgi:putative membrane protein
MSERNGSHAASGLLAGLVGGLVASWVMNEFMEYLGPSLQEALHGKKLTAEPSKQQDNNEPPKEDATMKTADAVVAAVTGGQHLTYEEKKVGGPIVHYAFGALMGGCYGALVESVPAATAGLGTAFGAALFTGADLVAVPALNLSQSSDDEPLSSLATPFAAHLVYGITTETVRRLVRSLL